MSGWTDYGFPDPKLVTPTKAFTGIIKALYERALWSYLEHPETRVISRETSGKVPDLPYPLDPIYYYGTKTYETTQDIWDITTFYSFLADFMGVLNNVPYEWCTEDSTPDNVVSVRNSDWYFTVAREIYPLVQKFPSELLKRIYDHINQLFRIKIRFGDSTQKIEYKKILLYRHLFIGPSAQGLSPAEIRSRLLELPLAESSSGTVAEDFYINDQEIVKPLYTMHCYDEELNWRNLSYWGRGRRPDIVVNYENFSPVYANSSGLKGNYYNRSTGRAVDVILYPLFRHTFEHNVTLEFYFKMEYAGHELFNFFPQFPGDSQWHKVVFENVPPMQEVNPIGNFVLPSDFSGDDGWGAWYSNYANFGSNGAFFLNHKCENGLEFVAPEPEEETEEE